MTAFADAIRRVMDVRGQGITDTRVLSAVERVPVDAFPPAASVAPGPSAAAVLLDALQPGDRHRVLLLPLGNGYVASLLSQLCRRVYTQDPDRVLRRAVACRLDGLGIGNVVTRANATAEGWPEQAPFDRILLTTVVAAAPPALLAQLRPGGVFVAALAPDRRPPTVARVARGADGFVRQDMRQLPQDPDAD